MTTTAFAVANPLVETRLPALPQIAAVTDPAAKSALEAIITIMRVREGVIGDPLDQALTFRDFYKNAGLPTGLDGLPYFRNRRTGNITFLPANEDASVEYAPPPAVVNLAAIGALTNFIISFNEPKYNNHAYTEIWRSGADDLGTAVLVGTTTSSLYADNVGATASTRYFWARNVSTANVKGPFNAVAGVSATTGFVSNADLADASVTTAKIANLAVDTTKLADLAVEAAKLAGSSVTATKIANAAVGSAAIANLAVGTAHIADAAILTAKIADAAITNAKIGSLAVDTANIANGAIVNAKIGALAVDSANIASAAITNAKIGTAQVDTLTIAGNAVTVPVQAFTAGSIAITAGVLTTLQSLTITTSGEAVLLIAQARMINANNDTSAIELFNAAGTQNIINSVIHNAGYDDTLIVCYVDTSAAAGTHTYNLRGKFVTNNGSAQERLLYAIEIKR